MQAYCAAAQLYANAVLLLSHYSACIHAPGIHPCHLLTCCATLCLRIHVQEWVQGPLQTEQMFLQGTDKTGRALAIIRVAGHVADKKALKDMKLFVCYVMNAMVSTLQLWFAV